MQNLLLLFCIPKGDDIKVTCKYNTSTTNFFVKVNIFINTIYLYNGGSRIFWGWQKDPKFKKS